MIPNVGRAVLIEAMATGDTWESVAALIGYTEPRSVRRAADSHGLRRIRMRDVVVIECKN